MNRLLLLLIFLWALPNFASADDAVAAAESALAQGRHDHAATLARDAIETGTRAGKALAPLLFVEARASALRGDEERSRRAFTQLLAVDPSFRLGQDVDEVRSPYMEARGFWSTHVAPFGAEIVPDAAHTGLDVRLLDPSGMAARVRLRLRVREQGEPLELMQASAESVHFDVPELPLASTAYYDVSLLDEHGNRLWQDGSEAEPRTLVLRSSEASVANDESVGPAARAPRRLGYVVGGSVSLALGAAAAGYGGYAHLERQQQADAWNRGDCGGNGATRGERCASERDDVERNQIAAGVSYGVGVAAIAVGLVLLLRSGGRAERNEAAQSFACSAAESLRGAQCTMRF